MSRSWGRRGADRNEAGSDGEGEGEGGARDLMDWDQALHTSTKDIVLFCIDAGPHMHKTNPDTGMSYLYSALYAACRFQEAKLIASPHDLVGIMLFGTEHTDVQDHIKKGTLYSHCTVLQGIHEVDVIPLTDLYDLLADDERGKYQLKDIRPCAPHKKPFRIENALGNAVHYMLSQGKTGYKRIFFMTNNDDPTLHREDVTEKAPTGKSVASSSRGEAVRRCLHFVKEANARNIELEPLLISSSLHAFDIERFYADVFATYDEPASSSDDDEDESGNSDESDSQDDSDLLEDLASTQRGAASSQKSLKAEKQERRLARQTRREQREARYRRLYDCATKMEEMQKSLEERQMPKRVTFNSTMTIGEKIQIGIKGYAMFSKATRGTPVRMVEKSDGLFVEVAAKVVPVCEDTGQILKPKKDIETAFSFGASAAAASIQAALMSEPDEQPASGLSWGAGRAPTAKASEEPGDVSVSGPRGLAKFSKAEIREMREMGVPHGIRLLGFKPQGKLEFWMNTKHATFLYPTDETWSGSKRFFASLLQSMAKKKVFAEALCLPRTGTTPFFAAVWPREEQISADGVQLAAPGMFLLPLPFADDMRDNPYGASLRAGAEEVEAAKAIVKKYTVGRDEQGKDRRFHPDHFDNPALALHYATLRAVVFNREPPKTSKIAQARADAAAAAGSSTAMAVDDDAMGMVGTMLKQAKQAEEVQDSTLPDYDAMKRLEDKNGLIQKFNLLIEKGGYGQGKGAPAKFKKKDEAGLKHKWQSGDLGTYKVDQLKAILTFYKEPVSGRKIELLERLDTRLAGMWG